jgi:PAS domain S-box-containing protein
MRPHWPWGVFLWLLAMPACAWAAAPLPLAPGTESVPLAGKLEFLEDRSARLTLAEVVRPETAARFRALPGAEDVNFGYSASAYWLRFRLRVAPGATANWLLEVGYPSLDRVEVYLAEAGRELSAQQAGDLQPFSQRPFVHRNLVFPLALAPRHEYTVYVRAVSQGNLTLPMTLWTGRALHRHDQRRYSLHALYLGALLALAAYNLLLFFSLRERQYLEYVAFALCMGVAMASLYGLGNQFLWPEWPWFGNAVFPAAMSATGLFGALFTRSFLDSRRTIPRLDRIIVVLILCFFAGVPGSFMATYRLAAIFVSLTGAGFSGLAVVAGVVAFRHDYHGARYFLLAWTLLLVGVLVTGLRNLSVIPTNTLTAHAMQLGSALEMLLLSFALADRFHFLRRAKEQAQSEAIAAKQQLVESLTKSEQELSGRVAARTRELQEREYYLRAILDNAADGIVSVNADGYIETANAAAETLLGYPASAMIGQPLQALFPGPSLAELLYKRERGAGIVYEEAGRRRDGTEVPVELAVGVVEFADRRLFVFILHDLTERKRVEKLQAEFVAAVSHELRTPLTSLRSSLALLDGGDAGALPADTGRLVHIAHNNVERLGRLINDILASRQLDYGAMQFDLRVQRLQPLVMKALTASRRFADQCGTTLTLQLPHDADVRVSVDGDRLIEALGNILSNALKFSPPAAEVEFAVSCTDDTVRVAVRDQGPGIPDDFRARIFQRFSRADDPDVQRHAGLGLGLSLAKGMIEKMGGRIDYDSVPGGGATFFIELPVVG